LEFSLISTDARKASKRAARTSFQSKKW